MLLLEQMLDSVQQVFIMHLYFIILPSVPACYTKEITGKGRAVARGDFVAPLYGLGSADILAV